MIDRLEEEHESSPTCWSASTGRWSRWSSGRTASTRVRPAMDVLTDALLSHLSYEERALVEPLARHGFY